MTMTSTNPAASVPVTRDEAGRLFGQTMALVAVTTGLFALGAYIGRDTSGGLALIDAVNVFLFFLSIFGRER